jgi:uncharacterized protein (UPF0276 family)
VIDRHPTLPRGTGLGLRAPHHATVVATWPQVAWFEVHSENYFADGGYAIDCLEKIRSRYPLSLHGVGLSLGSTDPLNREHLANLQRLCKRIEPAVVSEHLSWSSLGGYFTNDLLPLPYTEEAVRLLSERIGQVQDALQRRILLENVASYLTFTASTLTEWEFVSAVAEASGCGLLLDLNNVVVAAHNHGFGWREYLAGIAPALVQEFHLAGHERIDWNGENLLIDTHASRVSDAVWDVYAAALRRFGDVPTLIEWDTDVPAFDVLLSEARKADLHRDAVHAHAA